MRRIAFIMITICALIVSFSMSSCYYDVEEELYGSSCDTSNVTYSGTIKTLFTNYGCFGCHSGTSASGYVHLDTHAGIVSQINRIWPAINHTGPHPMPQGGNKMTDCDISKVKVWMDAGTPNN